MEEQNVKITKGVRTLLGNPKKAIIKISTPMMLGMLCQAVYNLADGFWVAGLGADELAAIGLIFPFFLIIIALGTGLGVGGSSAVSRRIGERNKKDADNTAAHTILIGLVIGLFISVPILPFLKNIMLSLSGNENIGNMAADYARIIFSGALILVFSQVANALFRGEGDAKRAMYGLLIGSGLNIILDPIFIYTFKMGVKGAAWATVTSISVSSLIFFYWLFIDKKSYLDITFKGFKINRKILAEILEVGIPSSLAQLSMSIAIIFLNKIVIEAGGTDGVAVFTSGWRIIMLGVIPLLGMATGVVAVTGAAYGARDRDKLKIAYFYSIKIGIVIELAVAVLVVLFSKQISFIFTYSEESARILDDLVTFLKILSIFYPTVPMGMLTSAMFRGIGKGKRSLIVTILRTIILQVPVAYLLGITFNLGLTGVWLGLISGNILAAIVTFSWGKHTVNHAALEPKRAD
ncbi:MAG: MATE family efflux transporter [Candidatus Aminicenantaceae bacterium]